MEPIKMLEELVVRFGSSVTAAKVGVDGVTLWFWLNGQEVIPPRKAYDITFIHDLEFNPLTRTDR